MNEFRPWMYRLLAVLFLLVLPVLAYHNLTGSWLVAACVACGAVGSDALTMTPERHQRNIRHMEELRERDRAMFENRPR